MHDAESPLPSELPEPDSALPASDALRQPLSRRERTAVIARIEALMEYWAITVADLEGDTPDLPPPAAAPRAVKYRHPVTGDTWDGDGPHPDWLRSALLKEGYRLDELRPGPTSEADH
ncbi:H-NS histone family protein [Ideonella oryzae]|uniref:H-NS histone family protein n=1 Tax=Ideonella oryzae TaxID=2937441 RepID=A0ABT1BRN9_9BURK|nr:H-NS histone family protein [Ideonella oryzae]MCO5978057.1 H-NS histone family protein [Ideonella oryzae]